AVTDNALVQGPRILSHTQGGIGAEQLGEIGGVIRRVADRQRRFFRVDLNRRNVKRKMGTGLGRQKPRNAVYLDAQARLELQPYPRRVGSRHQRVRDILNIEYRAVSLDSDTKRNC